MRGPRKRSESGIYHVILRGINRQDIFYDDDDYQRFVETVHQMKSGGQFTIYGYCLMTNQGRHKGTRHKGTVLPCLVIKEGYKL